VKRKLLLAAFAAAALAIPLSAQDADALLAACALPGCADSVSASVTVRMFRIDGSMAKREVRYLAQERDGRTSRLVLALSPGGLEAGKFLSGSEGDFVYGRIGGTKALSSSDVSRAFLGSDLSFEELGVPDPRATRNAVIGSEVAAGLDCYIVESVGAAGARYSKTLRWVAKDGGLLVKAEHFNAKGKAVKSVAVTALVRIDGRPSARVAEARDLVRGTSTTLEFRDLRYGAAIPEGTFSPASLAVASL
jgi:hypothetical protein